MAKSIVSVRALEGDNSKIVVCLVLTNEEPSFRQVFTDRKQALLFANDLSQDRGLPVEDLDNYDG
jgi:hypothetical protein